MVRQQFKFASRGGEVLSFDCPCGYRFVASTPTAQRLAFKLHGARCLLASSAAGENGLVNHDGPEVLRHKVSTASAVDAAVREARRGFRTQSA